MRLVVIADTHNMHKKVILPEGDVLIHCGDFSAIGRHHEVKSFLEWFRAQPHQHKIYIAGNHDLSYEREHEFANEMIKQYGEINYLEDDGIDINGIYFYGSPWTPTFGRWAFLLKRNGEAVKHICSLIPDKTNVLITHGPPKEILDKCMYQHPDYPQYAGCEVLLKRIKEVKPKYHLFGHIHEAYGMNHWAMKETVFVNASICNFGYKPENKPVVLDI